MVPYQRICSFNPRARVGRDVLKFKVIDKLTGKEADIKAIAETEEWAMLLMHIDMDGFAIKEDGTLLLMDECGNFVYCPKDRFEVCTI